MEVLTFCVMDILFHRLTRVPTARCFFAAGADARKLARSSSFCPTPSASIIAGALVSSLSSSTGALNRGIAGMKQAYGTRHEA